MLKRTESGYALISEETFFSECVNDCIVIALDFDGIFASSHECKSRFLKESGHNIPPEGTASSQMIKQGVPKEVYRKQSMNAYVDCLLNAPPEPGMGEYWPKIRSIRGVRIFIVTSRYDHMVDVMVGYFKKYNIVVDGICNVNTASKKNILKKLKPALFVDDSPEKLYSIFENDECTALAEELNHTKMVLFRNVANSYETLPRGDVVDLKGGWKELYEFILENVVAK